MEADPQNITQLLINVSEGDKQAYDRLLPLVYGELRAMAGRALRKERQGHTLQPTALVHEAYLKLIEQRSVRWHHRAHFFGIAAQLMRRILVDHARARQTAKRGGRWARVALDEGLAPEERAGVDVVALDAALERLAQIDAQQGRIVELRFFAGLSNEEVASVLGISLAMVKRDWAMARAWLYRELSREAGDE